MVRSALTSNRGKNGTSLTDFIGGSGVASLIIGGFSGRFADTSSRKSMLFCAALAAFCVLYRLFSYYGNPVGLWLPVILFFLLVNTHQGVRLSRKTYVVDGAEGNRRTEYVLVGNTVMVFCY
ncbi:MAG: putative MFS family arabinose efflux permease [Candidatus Endobugula sp.]